MAAADSLVRLESIHLAFIYNEKKIAVRGQDNGLQGFK